MFRIFLFVTVLLSGLDAEDVPRPSLVEVAPLTKGEVHRLQNFVGTLYFNQKSDLASETEGKVLTVHIDTGESVKKGDLLVTLEHSVLDHQILASQEALKEAQANYTKSQKDLKRYQKLLAEQSIAQSEYDTIHYTTSSLQSRVNALKASLDAQKIQRSKKKLYAPYDGIITAKSIEVGEWVKVGDPVVQMVNPYLADITFNIPESFLQSVKPKDGVSIMIASAEYTGTVKAIIPIGDKNTRTFPLQVTLKSDQVLFEGMEAKIQLPNMSIENALLIPRDGVIKRFGQQVIFANANNQAMMIPVTVVGYFEDQVAVDSPMLQEGMSIVIKGNERIFPNQPLQVVAKP